MKQLCMFAVLFLVITTTVSGQKNYRTKFFELVNKNDTIGSEKLIQEWKKEKPNDPEIYVAYFNLYVKKSMMNVMTIGDNPKGKEALVITDTDSNSKSPVGYMYETTMYEPVQVGLGFAYIDTGIVKFPARLDMRFGKIYILGEIGLFKSFTNEVVNTIHYSDVIKNRWLWTENAPVKDPEIFLLRNVQTYVTQLLETGDSAVDDIRKIAETVLLYYPENVMSLTNLAVTYKIKGDFDTALIYLLKAEKYAPEDAIVYVNITDCYAEKGDEKNAKKYYKLVQKYGNDDVKEFAKEVMDKLKKK